MKCVILSFYQYSQPLKQEFVLSIFNNTLFLENLNVFRLFFSTTLFPKNFNDS